jgi:dipeptidyl aminopeptidase/acylaminoacyl peptidase
MSARELRASRQDLRNTASYQEAHDFYAAIRRPGTGQISDLVDVHASADGKEAVFAGFIVDDLDGSTPTRICHIDLDSGQTRVLTFGPHNDRLPKFSPDGQHIAFLSDRHKAGDFQLYLLNPVTGPVRSMTHVDGWIEYLHWSPDGSRILLGVAGHGADLAGGQGAIASKAAKDGTPSWMPTVEAGDESYRWRRVWVFDLATRDVRQVGSSDRNVWEAVWCGNTALTAVVSPGPGEGLWYTARLALLNIGNDDWRDIYTPKDQLGWPAASPTGRTLAVVEAICSDRWLVAGDLRLIDTGSGEVRSPDTQGVDITYCEWRSERHLLVAGHRGFDTVVALYDTESGGFTEIWASGDISTPGRYATVSGFGDTGDCVLVGESFQRSPEIATLRSGHYRVSKSFDLGYDAQAAGIATVERVSWNAPDGLEIQGWLLRPQGQGPHPLVMNIHGGPVWQWHPLWLGRSRYAPFCLLVRHGYAVFFPNPRGSSGRGQDFARRVVGDMGGADTYDYLSGLDHLVQQGIADPNRLGVTGVSYGGFMTCWLITQDSRFAAAVPISPMTNHVTEHLLSNIPHFVKLFLNDSIDNLGGRYFQYSPVLHAHKARTPTLTICGALDRCTPPEEALQFHHALLESEVTSVLALYPEEGHGIHNLPAAIDFAARLIDWFQDLMPASFRKTPALPPESRAPADRTEYCSSTPGCWEPPADCG